jgi:hypothetical protein
LEFQTRVEARQKWLSGPSACRTYLMAGSAQQRKALLRNLIKEIQVVGQDEIVPTYRIPPLVRAVSGSVDPIGFEPTTSSMPWMRSTN